MNDNEKFVFRIYCDGVEIGLPVHGRERFLLERAFLDELVTAEFGRRAKIRPVPDPETDFYVLSDVQYDAYLTFRQRIRASEADR